jgi:hypothetical protein
MFKKLPWLNRQSLLSGSGWPCRKTNAISHKKASRKCEIYSNTASTCWPISAKDAQDEEHSLEFLKIQHLLSITEHILKLVIRLKYEADCDEGRTESHFFELPQRFHAYLSAFISI